MTDLPAYVAAAQALAKARAEHAIAAKRWRAGLALAAAQSAVNMLARFANDPPALILARQNLARVQATAEPQALPGPDPYPFPGFAP